MKAYLFLCIALMGGAWAQSQTCPTGMVYNVCGSGCPATCTVPSPLCSQQCVAGCFCPPGKVLNGTNTCVYPSDCPSAPTTSTPPTTSATTSTPPTTPSAPPCAAGKVHQSCGTYCPITCQNKDGPPQPCPLVCVSGCFCAAGTILNTVDGSCVPEANCPATTTSTATTNSPTVAAPPVFELAYVCPNTTSSLGVCVIEETCSSSGSQNCSSPSQLCCTNGCGGQVCTEGVLPTPLCTATREKALNKSQGLLGALIPQCEADGSFSAMQCFEGSCWCVNTATGESTSALAAPGLLGSLDCAPTTGTTSTPPTTPSAPPCAAGKVHQSCGTYCPITCQNKDGPPQPCPFVCVSGCFCAAGTILNTVDGSCVPEANCPASTSTATTNSPTVAAPPVFELAYVCPTSTSLFGACVIEETCSSSGSQKCSSPSQLCCTNGCGGQVCTEGVLPTPLCTTTREKALNKSQGLLGALIPQCEADGSFSAMQCFEGSCWCVNTTTGESTSALAAPGLLGSLDCAPTTGTTATAAPDHCSLAPESGLCKAYMPHMFFNSTSGTCERFIYGGCGGNANRFTSFISCMEECGGVKVPYSAVQSTLSQTLLCPSVTPSNGFGTCENLCTSDANCSSSEKCCSNGCGNVCVSAVSVPYYTSPQACPTSPFPFCNLLGCQSHEACGDSNLCCPTGCGSTCMTALTPARPCYETASYASSLNLIGSYVPQCNADGTYMAKQTHGSTGMSWCVDTTTGKALTAPTSDASLDCSVSTPVCTSGQVFTQCGSECPITCENKDNPPTCVDVCVSGCFCPAGTVSNGNTCVKPSECGPNCQGIQCDWPECPNNARPISDSKHCCPYCPRSCNAGGILLGEGQTYVDECTTCSCQSGTILCDALVCPIPIIRTMRVGMKFDGDYDSITDMDGLKSDVKRTLVNNYNSLQESQITEVHVTRGSVVITVVVTDKTDRTGANVTLLIIQMEQDYKEGALTIPLNDGTMRPTDKFVYGPHSTGSHAPFLFGIVGGVGFLLVVLIIVVLAALVIMIVVIKRTTHRHTRLPQTPEKHSGMKNPMFDLSEKA